MFGRSATILAQTNVRKRLPDATGSERQARRTVAQGSASRRHVRGRRDDLVQRRGDRDRPRAARHTDGDSIIFFKGSNVVHMGDQFFNGRFPFIDTVARAATLPAT